MPCPTEWIMVWGGGGDNDNLTLLHPEFFAAHAIPADRKTLLQKLQRNSRNQSGSPFECWSGQNVMDYSVSKTTSMSWMIWSFVITLLCSIVTRRLWDTLVTERHWNWYPKTTGGHKYPASSVSTLGHVTSASGPRFNNSIPPKNSTRSPSRRAAGASSVRTSLENSWRCTDMMQSWMW